MLTFDECPSIPLNTNTKELQGGREGDKEIYLRIGKYHTHELFLNKKL